MKVLAVFIKNNQLCFDIDIVASTLIESGKIEEQYSENYQFNIPLEYITEVLNIAPADLFGQFESRIF